MSRRADGRRLLSTGAALAWAFAAPAAQAGARVEVTGSQRAADGIEVELTLRNVGDATAARVSVEGELAGTTDRAAVDDLPPGAERHAVLRFPAGPPRPGTHAVALTVEYADGPESPVVLSQRASIVVAVGGPAAPAVRVAPTAARIGATGSVPVRLESADGAAHRVRLRILAPRDLRVDDPPGEVEVPMEGAVTVWLLAFRSSVPWGAERRIVVVVSAGRGGVERTSTAEGVVTVGPFPNLLPRLRDVLVVVAGVLFVVAVVVETRRHRKAAPLTPTTEE